ncbi:MAG: hypothetical protein IKN73_01835 [Alphaproteobacteria bacterium]|nr:hypothetical protein [Alphaproteobacteria bacterium]
MTKIQGSQTEDYKTKYYRSARRGRIERQLAAILFRVHKSNPIEAYLILQSLTDLSVKKDLLNKLNKFKNKYNTKEFTGFYMLYRITLPNNPRLKQLYWQNNLALLYANNPELSKSARLKGLRSHNSERYHPEINNDIQTPENIVQTPKTIVQTPGDIVQTIKHVKDAIKYNYIFMVKETFSKHEKC